MPWRLLSDSASKRNPASPIAAAWTVIRGFWNSFADPITGSPPSKHRCRQGLATEDGIDGLLRDHDGRCVGIARWNERHHRGVDDTQATDASYFQIGRGNGSLARAHRASADGMVVRLAGAISILHQVVFSLDALARLPFGEHERFQRRLTEDVAGKPQALQRALAVVRIGP